MRMERQATYEILHAHILISLCRCVLQVMLDVEPSRKIQKLQLAGAEGLSNTTILLLPSGEPHTNTITLIADLHTMTLLPPRALHCQAIYKMVIICGKYRCSK